MSVKLNNDRPSPTIPISFTPRKFESRDHKLRQRYDLNSKVEDSEAAVKIRNKTPGSSIPSIDNESNPDADKKKEINSSNPIIPSTGNLSI